MAKLYTTKGNTNGFKAMVAALYNGVPLQVPENFSIEKHASSEPYLALSPLGQVPCLEVDGASIHEPNAILRYVMRANLASQLYGRNAVEQAQVDSFIDFAAVSLEAPLNAWTYPIHGLAKYNHQVVEQAKKDISSSKLPFLEAHLATRTFLVGECVTGADIACVLALLDASKEVFDAKFRAGFPNVFRWFMTCVNQAEFIAVIGQTELCVTAKDPKPAKAEKAPKGGNKQQQQQQPKQPKKEKVKAEPVEEAPKPAKRENPLDSLPKSSLNLDEWKRMYSNSDWPVARQWITENFDSEGYCWYFCKYQYPNDFNALFNANNLVNGFIQRLESLRKYGFGSICICGLPDKAPWNIYGVWLFRGNEIPFEMHDCPDAEVYDFEPCDLTNPEHLKKWDSLMAAEGPWFDGPEMECQTWKSFK
jgi:elongation factor 1-gamma